MRRRSRRAAALAAACVAGLAARPCAAADSPEVPPCARTEQGYENPSLVTASSGQQESAAGCQEQCRLDTTCEFFTWYYSTKECWLYPAGMTLETLPGAIGGPKVCDADSMLAASMVATPEPQLPAPTAPPAAASACLLWYGDGCSSIQSRELCLSSRDGRPMKHLHGFLTAGQPCVWCGGGACGAFHPKGLQDTSLCQPFDWVKERLAQPNNFTAATCKFGELLPQQILDVPEANPRVNFTHAGHACRGTTITDAGGGDNSYYWTWTANTLRQCKAFCTQKEMCKGIEYNAANNYCEVWWKDIGWTDDSAPLHDYECYRATAAPHWDHPELSCLRLTSENGGCNALRSEADCLSSRDGRSMLKWNGLLVKGEPCVWCGGGPCTDRSDNVCEDRDFLLHGQNRVYRSFLAEGHYSVANCTSAPTASEAAQKGRFISSGESVFWIPPGEGAKHLVPSTLNCSACACRSKIEVEASSSYVDSLADGEPFSCSMLAGASTRSASPSLAAAPAEADAESSSDGGLPWWTWMFMLMGLCGVAGICALLGLRKPVRPRKRKALSPGTLDAGSDEELSRLMEDHQGSSERGAAQQEALQRPPPFVPRLQQHFPPPQGHPQLMLPQPPSPLATQAAAMAMRQGFGSGSVQIPLLPPPHVAGPLLPPPHAAGPVPPEGLLSGGSVPGGLSVGGLPGFGGPIEPLGGPPPPSGSVRPIQLVGGVDPRRTVAGIT